MNPNETHQRPGVVRDAILAVMSVKGEPMPVGEITTDVQTLAPGAAASSVRSYLQNNTPDMFVREGRGVYRLLPEHQLSLDACQSIVDAPIKAPGKSYDQWSDGALKLFNADCLEWLADQPENCVHAVVTDPPYGLHEYTDEQVAKLRSGKGGVWRIPPSFDGHVRSPLPRFTTLTSAQLNELDDFFYTWATLLTRCVVPGGNIVVASNPLLSYIVAGSMARAGLERRGEIIRLVMTMRGGDRPKHAHDEFDEVSVLPRSMWEPWLLFRRPIEGRVQDNLRTWGTGGFRRPSKDKPFGDVIRSCPTRKTERDLAPHPSLKPQAFMRQLVRASLPLGEGVVLDPFAGSGSTLAAAKAVGYQSVGVERDPKYFKLAQEAIQKLSAYTPPDDKEVL